MKPVDPRLLRHARHSRAGIVLLAVLGIGQAAATVTVAEALTLLLAAGSSRFVAVTLLAAAFATRAALTWAEQVVAHRTAARVSDELRRSLIRAVARRGPVWVAGFGSGRLTALLTTGLDALRPWFAGYLPAVVLGAALPPLVLLVIFRADPASAVVALLTLPLIPLLGALIGWATEARARQRWQADARLAGHFLDVVRGLATLRTFGRATRQTAVIEDLTDRHRSATLRVLRVAFLSSTALDLVGTLSVGLIAVSAGLRVASGHLALAPALLVILLAPEVYRPLREMAARYHAATDATAVVSDVDEVLTDTPGAAGLSPADRPGLRADGLRVRYPRTTIAVPDLEVAPGEIVALVGPSGAGKTSALRALAGLQPCDAGWGVVGCPVYVPQRVSLPHARVVADLFPEGVGSAEVEGALGALGLGAPAAHGLEAPAAQGLEALMAHESEAPAAHGLQSAGMGAWGGDAATSPRRRIAPGAISALPTPTLRWAGSSQAASSDNLATSSPITSSTITSSTTASSTTAAATVTAATRLGERGAGVSAGQRHRLALAAALQRGPATFLLDEPTAHLDPETEQLIIARLREAAAAGSAVLVAAHRPALIAAADRVVEIEPPSLGTPAMTSDASGSAAQAATGDAPMVRAQAATTGTPRVPAQAAATAAPTVPTEATTGAPVQAPTTGTPAVAAHATATAPTQAATSGTPAVPAQATATGTSTQAPAEEAPTSTPAFPPRAWQRLRRPWTAVALGSGSSLAGLVLTGAAAWLLVRAASLPPVLTLSAAVVLVRASAVARPLLRYAERLLAHDVAFARLGKRRARVYEALIPRVPGARLHRRGDLLTRVVDDVDAQVDGLLRGRLPAWSAWVTLAVAAAVAVLVVPALAVPVGSGLLIAGVLAPDLAARQASRREAATSEARAELRDAMVETVDGIEELRGSELLGVPDRRSRKLARREAQAARSAGAAGALAHAGWGVAVVGAAVVLGRAGLSPEWTGILLLGLVVAGESALGLPEAAVARMRAAGADGRLGEVIEERDPIGEGGAVGEGDTIAEGAAVKARDTITEGAAVRAGDAIEARAAIKRIKEPVGASLTTPTPFWVGPSKPPTPDNPPPLSTNGLTIRGLAAGWGGRTAIRGLDLDLPKGGRLAVTGRSGVGKTTLGMVLARFLAPRAGTVTLDGRDMRALPEEEVRRRVVLVGDDTGHIFATTVRDNLRLAKPAATDDELRRVLERVRLGGWEHDLDTWLGTGGSTISGGQARRLAMARALLADPEVLILDEPTEGLDEPTAKALMTDLVDAAGDRTLLILTHRTEGLDGVSELRLT